MRPIVMLSGGLDSVVCLYRELDRASNPRALFVDFGKRSNPRELSAAKRACLSRDVPLEVIDARGLRALQLGYADPAHIESDEMDVKGEPETRNPISGFNVIMAIGIFYAQLTGFERVVFGLIQEQSESRPDLFNVGKQLTAAQKLLNPSANTVEFDFPLSELYKKDVIRVGADLSVPFDESWSCLRDGVKHCGVCEQCTSRKSAFADAGINDPTEYLE